MRRMNKKNPIKFMEEEFRIEDFKLPIDTHFKAWQDELNEELKKQEESVKNIIRLLLESNRIFTVAVGRSGLAALNTGVRFMHTGFSIFEIGHPFTPAIGNDEKYNDVLYAISGSGNTRFVVNVAERAKENNVPIIAVTSNPDSKLASLSTEKIVTSGKRIYTEGSNVPREREEPINFLQTKSEFKALCIGELLVNCIAKAKGTKEIDMKKRHDNTE